MNCMRILAIETSCDETAASVIEKTGGNLEILSNVVASQINIHKKYGGVFPEHASRAHVEKIIPVVKEALGNYKPDVIAVTTGPGLIGSLLIGVNFAKTLAYAKNLPIIGINHWLGHIYSCFIQSEPVATQSKSRRRAAWSASRALRTDFHAGEIESAAHAIFDVATASGLPQFPALILIASGGHTGLVLMKSHKKIVSLGETLDDAAGEAFDKIAKLLDLGYPGGPAISKTAEKGDPKAYDFPRSMLERKDFDFSFSGLKTAVLYEIKKQKLTAKIKKNMAASFQQAVIDILIGKTIQAAYEFRPKSICLCGGVSANKELREQMKKAVSGLPMNPSFHAPAIHLSTDNAAMIGIAAAYHLNDKTTYDKINANANLGL